MKGYYYCSLDTFLNIVKRKEIYLSDPLKMNDSLEIKWYLEKLREQPEDRCLDEPFDSRIFEAMKSRSHIDFNYEELIENINSNGQRSAYICCFSKRPDILSQWRTYANDGCGVAIGFDLDKLKIADNFFVKTVKYTNEVCVRDDETDVEVVADSISIFISEEKIIDKEEQIRVFLHELITVLVEYKNPAFKEEQEVRLIYCDDLKFEKLLNRIGAINENYIKLEHDFRTISADDITEFVRMPFKEDVIREIYIGPKCRLSENDVTRILCKNNINNVSVKKSSASYR